jgi:hypothetical protein
MPELTRRPHPERSDCWHVYYGDVQVGTIAVQAGMPLSVQQWRWDCGFYPPHTAAGPAPGTRRRIRFGFSAPGRAAFSQNKTRAASVCLKAR